MKIFFDAWNEKFQTEKYPIDFYLHNLQEIKNAVSSEKLAKHIIDLLSGRKSKEVFKWRIFY